MGVTNVAEGSIVKTWWIAAIAIVILAVLGAVYYLSTHASGNEEGTRIDLIGSNGTTTVYVEIADTPQEQEKGLMDRTSMDEDRGMLFVFSGDHLRSFWMKNTPLPLDMVFVNSDYTIVDINHNAMPESETVFTSRAACKYVVEVNDGYCDAHGIGIGDRIKIY